MLAYPPRFARAPPAHTNLSWCSTCPRGSRWLLRGPTAPVAASPGSSDGGGSAASSGGGGSAAEPASFLQNPAIAQREILRQFYMASSAEEQQRLLQQAGERVDAGTSLQMLCHTADLAQKGMLPGSLEQQEQLLRLLHSRLAGVLPTLQPVHLATALWSYAAVGIAASWTDDLLQQVAELELGQGQRQGQRQEHERGAASGRVQGYNTRELSSMVFAYGRLLRRYSPEAQQYCTTLLAELGRRWAALPYVKSNFSSTDFADLAQACARLYGADLAPPPGAPPAAAAAVEVAVAEQAAAADAEAVDIAASGYPPHQHPQPQPQPLPPPVASLLDDLAGEVRRQLANKHSLRSPWTPRDLVRYAGAYAALGHRSRVVCQMLDVLSSFCVQRIRSRHLNCVSRPADLAGLLEAYADLAHSSVAVPELLAAVGDQVRRGAAAQQEALEAAAAAAAAAAAEAQLQPKLAGGPSAATAAGAAGAAGSLVAGADGSTPSAPPAVTASAAAAPPPAPPPPPPAPAAPPIEGFSLAGVSSLVDSHLRLGYAPPPLLLQALAPQIRRQLPLAPATDAATLLGLLAAVPYNPGTAMVGLLLGRVVDEAGAGSPLAVAAQQAADVLVLGEEAAGAQAGAAAAADSG